MTTDYADTKCDACRLIPSYTGALILRSLRLLRIISFLRLERSYNAMRKLRAIFANKKEELLVVSYLSTVVVLTSSTAIFFLENSTQPDVFSSIGVCAWWSIETITSLGYGDIVPKTSVGRIFGSILAVWGIILFAIPGAVLSSGFIEVMLEKQRNEEGDEYNKAVQAERQSSTRSSSSKHFFPENDEDGALRIALPVTPPSSGSESFRKMSPRVATALQLEHFHQKMDAMAGTQVSELLAHVGSLECAATCALT